MFININIIIIVLTISQYIDITQNAKHRWKKKKVVNGYLKLLLFEIICTWL